MKGLLSLSRRRLGIGQRTMATGQKPYTKPSFLADDYDHLGKQDPSVKDEEFLPDYLVRDAPAYKRNPVSINLPWLINGAPAMDIKTRFMGEQVFARMKVHKAEVLEHLFKIFRAVLLAAQDRDFAFLEQYCEETFYEKLRNRLNQLRANQVALSVEEDVFADKGKPL